MSASDSPKNVLVVDAGHGVGPLLADLLAARGLEVVAWTPDGGAVEDAAEVRWVSGPDLAAVGAGPFDAVVFNASGLDEAALLAAGTLADAVAADGAFFLETLQTAARAMMEAGRGQIWTLGFDDSFAYYLPIPIAPVTHHARIGAVRALAKELSRFGVSANAAILQPAPEATDPAIWPEARAGLASYAQKFKAVPLVSIADTLAFWLRSEAPPLNGSVIHFGTGVYDGNL